MTMWIAVLIVFGIFDDLHQSCQVWSECCDAYYDLTFTYNKQTWCDNYCCGTSALGVLECCDNFLLQAQSDDRQGFCLDYFAKNIWAPIVIGLGGLGCLLCCVACCYCCCHSNNPSRTVVVPAQQQPYHTNVMLLNPTSTQQPGYNPSLGAYPAYPDPSGIQPVPGNQQTETKHPLQSAP